MTVKELCDKCGFKPLCLPSPDRNIIGAYTGDLLSWVMGRAFQNNAWITIMTNINVVAVASLSDVSCVIIAEDAVPDEAVIKTAESKGVNLISSSLPSYETGLKLNGIV